MTYYAKIDFDTPISKLNFVRKFEQEGLSRHKPGLFVRGQKIGCQNPYPACVRSETNVGVWEEELFELRCTYRNSCPGCGRTRHVELNERKLGIFPDLDGAKRDLISKLNIPAPPPFGAGPATQGNG